MKKTEPLLAVRNLSVEFQLGDDRVRALRDISFDVEPGETLGLAGESGCGKSTAAMAVMNLLQENGRIAEGEILFQGEDLARMNSSGLRKIWWKELSIVFQGALNSLNPVRSVGSQIAEVFVLRGGYTKNEAWQKVGELFELIGIRAERASGYPHEFSGGMRQRVMIAMAVCLNPKLLIADECTTALDVMIQTQIINLLKDLRETLNLSMIFINHDLALIAEICDRVAVMYAGRIVEMGTVREVFFAPAHPYVVQLLRALPRMEGPVDPLSSISGTPPHLREISEGCSFLPRCLEGDAACARKTPPTIQVAPGHLAACIKASTASGEGVRHG